VFPHNPALSQALAKRCALLVGVDPSDNLDENRFVHRRVKRTIEEFESEHTYDLASLRMVAEHIPHPKLAVESLARLIRPGGRVVVYTPNRWSPISVASSVIPFWLHHAIKSLIWRTGREDTFPTFYRMNTRRRLRALFEESGFKEVGFAYLDDCTTAFARLRVLCLLQLVLWRLFRAVRLRYPENCLLGVYERE